MTCVVNGYQTCFPRYLGMVVIGARAIFERERGGGGKFPSCVLSEVKVVDARVVFEEKSGGG